MAVSKRMMWRVLAFSVGLLSSSCAEPRAEWVKDVHGQFTAFASDFETDEMFALVANPLSLEHDLVKLEPNCFTTTWVSNLPGLSSDARYTRVAVGGQYVFWMDRDGVHAIHRQTREQRLISSDASVELSLARSVGPDHVAWVDRARTKILYASGTGVDTRVAATAPAQIL